MRTRSAVVPILGALLLAATAANVSPAPVTSTLSPQNQNGASTSGSGGAALPAGWTYTVLHPPTASISAAFAVTGTNQGGFAFVPGTGDVAVLWTGSAPSWQNLNPTGSTESFVYGAAGSQQAGSARIGGVVQAGIWSGSAGSWNSLHPAGSTASVAFATSGSQQAGVAHFNGFGHAGIWTGTAGSWIDLHPTGAAFSFAHATNGTQQAGYAAINNSNHAGIWSGTAASWVDLHPAGSTGSKALATIGSRQGGYAEFSSIPHAALWNGSAGSFVDLHPGGAQNSNIDAMAGTYQVGRTQISGWAHASIWSGTSSSWFDLHSVLSSNYAEASEARAIFQAGNVLYVVGAAMNTTTAQTEAILWTFDGAQPCNVVPGECCSGRPSFDNPAYASFGNLVSVGTAGPDAVGSAVVAVFDLVNPNGGPFNTDFGAPIYTHPSWSETNLGSIFGVTLDPAGNIYVASTTCYYMDWIGSLGGSAGAVYKLDTNTSVASLFVTVPNSGPALGNICYDCEFDQFFVSNMDDGQIYRIKDTSGSGVILDSFDFGTISNPVDGIFAPLGDRVWAAQKHDHRLYFSVWREDYGHQSATQANEIWSMALNNLGGFSTTAPRLEISMPPWMDNYSNPVSDMRFTPSGTMLVAEHGMWDETTPYPHQARLLEFECVNGIWTPSAHTFFVGAYAVQTNSAGGVDMDYDAGGRVYVTGDALQLAPSQTIYGTQGLPATGGSVLDSILVDYNGDLGVKDKTFIGDVAIPCGRCGPNPLAFYRFDSDANIGLDSSGHGHDGVLGGATVVSGLCGMALYFDPANNVHEFTIPHAADLDLTGAMTGMALIRPLGQHSTDNEPGCAEGTIFSKGGNYWFSVGKYNDKLVFQNEGSGTESATADAWLCVNEWTHVAFVRAADGKTIRFFKNGLPIGSPTTLTLPASANPEDVMVGNYGFGSNPIYCEFNGDLDEIRIYDRALSDAEVLAAYLCGCPVVDCNGLARFCLPDFDATSCPCGNPPAGGGLGCDNFGACTCNPQSGTLDASGNAIVGTSDSLVLEVSGMNNISLTVFFAGTTQVPSAIQGAGLRCVGGSLKRLYIGSGSGGAINRPGAGDLSVSARSAALGSPITPGETRYYFNVYRDPQAAVPCGNTSSTVNTTNSGSITWM